MPKDSTKPLWARVLDDLDSKKWLKKNKKEFPSRSFLPDQTAFKDKVSEHHRFTSELVVALLPNLTGIERRVAELYLKMHPAAMAKELGWPRERVYLAIRRLKRSAIRHWRETREADVLCRDGNLKLDAPAGRVAIRTVRFTLHGKERGAFLVSRDDETIWVDDEGDIFESEVQDILNELGEHLDTFEVLHAEEGS